jgi:hypothetical protein
LWGLNFSLHLRAETPLHWQSHLNFKAFKENLHSYVIINFTVVKCSSVYINVSLYISELHSSKNHHLSGVKASVHCGIFFINVLTAMKISSIKPKFYENNCYCLFRYGISFRLFMRPYIKRYCHVLSDYRRVLD